MSITSTIILLIIAFFVGRIPLNYALSKNKKLYGVIVRGKEHTWEFETWVDEKYVQEWKDDGIEIDHICNTIPDWIVNIGLARIWVWLQDHYIIPNE